MFESIGDFGGYTVVPYIQFNGSWVWVIGMTLMGHMGHGSTVLTHGQL